MLSSFDSKFCNVKIVLGKSRSSSSQMFFEIGFPKNFAIFIGKHLCQRNNKVAETPPVAASQNTMIMLNGRLLKSGQIQIEQQININNLSSKEYTNDSEVIKNTQKCLNALSFVSHQTGYLFLILGRIQHCQMQIPCDISVCTFFQRYT